MDNKNSQFELRTGAIPVDPLPPNGNGDNNNNTTTTTPAGGGASGGSSAVTSNLGGGSGDGDGTDKGNGSNNGSGTDSGNGSNNGNGTDNGNGSSMGVTPFMITPLNMSQSEANAIFRSEKYASMAISWGFVLVLVAMAVYLLSESGKSKAGASKAA